MTTLVCLPGWAMGPAAWSPLAGALPTARIDARALPLPADDATTGNAALDAMADRLAPQLPVSADLCGWSLGAMLALALARRHPGRVARLVLIGATPRFTATDGWPHAMAPHTLAQFRAALADDAVATIKRFCALQAQGDVAGRPLARTLLEASLAADMPGALPQLAAGLHILASADLRESVPEVRQPVLLLHGERDALMPPAAARWLRDALPRAQCVCLPGRGHAPHLSDPGLVARRIAQWRAGVDPEQA